MAQPSPRAVSLVYQPVEDASVPVGCPFRPRAGRNKNVTIPFGKQDCKLPQGGGEDTIQEFAPALRTSGQVEAFRVALQMLGDLTGFGI